MTKFKLEKEVLPFKRLRWHYRDFIIEDIRYDFSPYAMWKVKLPNGVEVYENGNGTSKEMIEWVDDYYQDMNDFVNSNEFNEIGE